LYFYRTTHMYVPFGQSDFYCYVVDMTNNHNGPKNDHSGVGFYYKVVVLVSVAVAKTTVG